MIFSGKSGDLVAVDFSNNRIKILRGQNQSGKMVIQDVYLQKLQQGSDAEILKEILEYFKKNRISAKKVTCVIPSKLFISKNVEIPSTEREEISKIIDLQAGRFTPYSRDEIVIDFLCMETPTQHYTSVLLVIVNRTLVDRYCRIFEDLGISVQIRVSSEAMAIHYHHWAKDWGWPDFVAVGGLSMGEDASDFTVMDHKQMVFVRSLPIGAEHFRADRDLALSGLISELNKSLAAYLDQGLGKPIKHLIVTGFAGNDLKLQTEIVSQCPVFQKFETAVKSFDLRERFQMNSKSADKLEEFKLSSFSELMMVLGAADQPQMDLIPKEIRLKRRFRDDSRELTSLGVTIMTLFIVLSLFLYTKIYFKNSRMEKIEQAGKETFSQARTLEKISTKNRVVRKILKTRGKGLSAFDEITEFLGESTYLSRLDYDVSGKIILGGTAESMSQVFALVNRLESSNRYLSVKATQTKTRREGTRDVADFEVECILPESSAAEKWEAEKAGIDSAKK